ncbi:uncharacterized protein [Spinacia oleracea]|uniref:Reverse transcriptase domain-containing protein n=1 Tax=Spinacia oleracea TaxID=3562 RepID=A0ABM3QZL9_SPIOL|nr:uncharacterized protein LOC110787661 [Spinacia oleracea]
MEYYRKLLGTESASRSIVMPEIVHVGPTLEQLQKDQLLVPVTGEEVKHAMFSINGDKAPGPDGFGSHFFKENWNIVGEDVTKAFLDFFHTEKLLKKINSTTITLIPKTKCPKPENQGAFVHGRFIMHNIMMCQEIVRQYGRKNASPGCLIKLDMQKAYDTIEWDFFGRNVGDPLSPLLFVVCMEYLSRTLHKVGEDSYFKFHPRCRSTKLTHLCFADDLILCCKGAFNSIHLLLKGFKLFSNTSGLKANIQKYAVYCAGMKPDVVAAGLVDKMMARIKTWSSRNISFAGRITLINAVLLSIHSYWAQVFILPKHVLKTVEAICRAFLWQGTYFCTKPGYVALEKVCSPKKEGGLGIRKVQAWNIAALGKYVWAIARKQDTMWVRWVNAIYIKAADWWEYQSKADNGWYWRKICGVKEDLKVLFTKAELAQMHKYSIHKVYQKLVQHHDKVPWGSAVWNRASIPKTRVICWLMVQGRLQTRTRLHKMGIYNSTKCLLYEAKGETHSHLFFDCEYSRRCLQGIESWLDIPTSKVHYMGLLRWIKWKSNCSKFQKTAMHTAVNAIVYVLWRARNDALWNQKVPTPSATIRFIQRSVIDRLAHIGAKQPSTADQIWWKNKCAI